MRALFDHAFRPAKIKQLDPFVERPRAPPHRRVHRRRARATGCGSSPCRCPLIVIGKQMGAPEEDIWRIKAWTDAWVQRLGMMQTEEEADLVDRDGDRGAALLPADLRAPAPRARRHLAVRPRQHAEIPEWGRTLTDNELHAEMMADTFVGGSETSDQRAVGRRHAADREPARVGAAEGRPRQLPAARFVEEVLRLEGPVQGLFRVTRASTSSSTACTIPAGLGAQHPLRRGQPRRASLRVPGRPRPRPRQRPLAPRVRRSAPTSASARRWPAASCYLGFKALVERIDEMWFVEGANDFRHAPNFCLRALKELHIGFTPAASRA